jgi:hypothetical protein
LVEIGQAQFVVGFEKRARTLRTAPRSRRHMPEYVLFTYPDPDYAERWNELEPEERHAEIWRTIDWFDRHRERIRGGEELDWPRNWRTVRRRGGEPVVTDGPYVESKELLGGFIVVEAASVEEACAMAADWPSLLQGEGALVQVAPVTHTELPPEPRGQD